MPALNNLSSRCFLVVLLAISGMATSARGQGIMLPAVGAVNRGMGGATTGAAVEAIGSLYWNPATISQLPTNEMALGFDAIYVNYNLSSTLPGVGAGSTDGEQGANPVPSIGWVHHDSNRGLTYGLGLFGVAGFSVNMPPDLTNPVLTPPAPLGGAGVGGIRSDAVFFHMTPTLSMKLSERLSIGGGPIIGMGRVSLDDNLFAPVNADLLYPRGDGTRYHWGLGAQLGLHYLVSQNLEAGLSIKTPTWFEPFRYMSETATGAPRVDEVNVNLPMIISGGLGYRPSTRALYTADIRYVNYSDTEGFGGAAGYTPGGAITGLGWDDQVAISFGAQIQLTERLIARTGYLYTSELFDDSDTFFNIGSDLSYQHVPSVGATYHLSCNASVSFAYNYLLEWDSSGPYVLPTGTVPGSNVSTESIPISQPLESTSGIDFRSHELAGKQGG